MSGFCLSQVSGIFQFKRFSSFANKTRNYTIPHRAHGKKCIKVLDMISMSPGPDVGARDSL